MKKMWSTLVYCLLLVFPRFSKRIQDKRQFIDNADRTIREMYEDGTIRRIEALYLD